MAAPVALITGVTGQDGAYLAEFLLGKGYFVHGIVRRSSSINTGRIEHLYQDPHEPKLRFLMHYGDMTDATNLIRIVQETQPTEIYNLAAQSHVKVSFETPEYTANADALGTLRLLEAIRILRIDDKVRFYQASTSELYGGVYKEPQNETTPFHSRSPYATAKLYAYWMTVNYREAYGMHLEWHVKFGRRDARRDWGHARDYVEGMWLILQQPKPDDYVLATGEAHSVREFVEKAFACTGRKIAWRGKGESERGVEVGTGKVLVEVDPRYFRPTEVDYLVGDAAKARRQLGWQHRISFNELVEQMVKEDLNLAKQRTASQP